MPAQPIWVVRLRAQFASFLAHVFPATAPPFAQTARPSAAFASEPAAATTAIAARTTPLPRSVVTPPSGASGAFAASIGAVATTPLGEAVLQELRTAPSPPAALALLAETGDDPAGLAATSAGTGAFGIPNSGTVPFAGLATTSAGVPSAFPPETPALGGFAMTMAPPSSRLPRNASAPGLFAGYGGSVAAPTTIDVADVGPGAGLLQMSPRTLRGTAGTEGFAGHGSLLAVCEWGLWTQATELACHLSAHTLDAHGAEV